MVCVVGKSVKCYFIRRHYAKGVLASVALIVITNGSYCFHGSSTAGIKKREKKLSRTKYLVLNLRRTHKMFITELTISAEAGSVAVATSHSNNRKKKKNTHIQKPTWKTLNEININRVKRAPTTSTSYKIQQETKKKNNKPNHHNNKWTYTQTRQIPFACSLSRSIFDSGLSAVQQTYLINFDVKTYKTFQALIIAHHIVRLRTADDMHTAWAATAVRLVAAAVRLILFKQKAAWSISLACHTTPSSHSTVNVKKISKLLYVRPGTVRSAAECVEYGVMHDVYGCKPWTILRSHGIGRSPVVRQLRRVFIVGFYYEKKIHFHASEQSTSWKHKRKPFGALTTTTTTTTTLLLNFSFIILKRNKIGDRIENRSNLVVSDGR